MGLDAGCGVGGLVGKVRVSEAGGSGFGGGRCGPFVFKKSGNTVRAYIYFIIEMSDKVHYKGRFIKQKVLNKRLKAVAAMAEAKKCQKSVLN